MGRILFFLALITSLPTLALADGKVFGSRDFMTWRSVLENEQRAYLSLDAGVQRMIVGISIDAPPEAVWLLPVRAAAGEVKLDLIDTLPRPMGINPTKQRRQLLDTLAIFVRAGLIAPLLVDSCLLPSLGRDSSGVNRHEAIEKFGLRSELVSADSIASLQTYLQRQKVTLTDAQLASFNPYFDGKHCFVVTWVKDEAALAAASAKGVGVAVRFPSDELWYPMRATSGYGDEKLEVRILVEGFVDVAARGAIRDIDVDHFVQWETTPGLEHWVGDARPELTYTRIAFHSPATAFTEDMTFRPAAGPNLAVARLVRSAQHYSSAILLLTVLVTSLISGIIAARVCGGRVGEGLVLGFAGAFTIVALHLVLKRHVQRPDATVRPAMRVRYLVTWAGAMLTLSLVLTLLARL